MQSTHEIPRFFLYEEQHSEVELDFLHVEPIHERSGKHDWTIRPHSHPDHMQILVIVEGGGWITIEDTKWEIKSPCLIVIPAGKAHEIGFDSQTDGYVVTAAINYIRTVSVADRRLMDVCLVGTVYLLNDADIHLKDIIDSFKQLHKEFIWSAIGRRPAIMAQFLRILVGIMRIQMGINVVPEKRPSKDYELIMQYREMVEQKFRKEKNLEYYAKNLNVTLPKLNQACKSQLGKTSSELLYERMIVEAKRYLLYSELTVAEIGYSIGFDDPAYFSRFFSKRVGIPPGTYRNNQ